MDAIYLAQKFSKPLGWDQWVAVREMVDYVCTVVSGSLASLRKHAQKLTL